MVAPAVDLLPGSRASNYEAMSAVLNIVLRCTPEILPRARYVFDTLLMAAGITVAYVESAPPNGPFLLYSADHPDDVDTRRCVRAIHSPEAWRVFCDGGVVNSVRHAAGVPIVLGDAGGVSTNPQLIPFDIAANAFYFLSSFSERSAPGVQTSRYLYASSVFARLGLPQDIVDRYLECLTAAILQMWNNLGIKREVAPLWPCDAEYAVVLSHDVDFVPKGVLDNLAQGVKTVLRHLIRQRDPVDALRSAAGFLAAMWQGRDPYGCIPELIERERELGVKSSFQVAVGRRHPNDVAYRIDDQEIREYLALIPQSGFDLCLHGSYRSTENPSWYEEEVELLGRRLARPTGSRQHYLSFHYDRLFAAQERSGIRYDMSMGYPDRVGPRAGFSYPYFPYCLDADRPYDVLQISLLLMDVTLHSYMRLKGEQAWRRIEAEIGALKRKGGCASVVWHPIVFGGARDPGYDGLYWRLIHHVQQSGGIATDGRTINENWRRRAAAYASFAGSCH